MNYKKINEKFWNQGYYAPNVESFIFRFYGRFLKNYYKKKKIKLLDFGCGQGANLNFFYEKGYECHGIDISKKDVSVAKKRYPKLKNNFTITSIVPEYEKIPNNLDVILASQSLYYLSKRDFNSTINLLHSKLNKRGIIFASMINNEEKTFFKNSKKTKDSWLRLVKYKIKRHTVKKHYLFFTNTKKDLIRKFSIFKPISIGSYHCQLDENEISGNHFTFIGKKT